jgi:hypothetical protein
MAKKWRVKLYDDKNNPWDLVLICHQYPDVYRCIKSKNLRATHFTSLEDAKKYLKKFIDNDSLYDSKIIEI